MFKFLYISIYADDMMSYINELQICVFLFCFFLKCQAVTWSFVVFVLSLLGWEKKKMTQMLSLKMRAVTRLIIGKALIIFIKGERDHLFT